jgi:uncharacterized phiE125 gp8 family phage protein
MLLRLATPPALEPVTLAEAKEHLRVLHGAEDALIGRLIKAVREHAEPSTGRAFITQTWDFWLPAFTRSGLIELPRPPLQAVTWVKYLDRDGVEQTVDPVDYVVVAPGLVGTVQPAPDADWPATQRHPQAVSIRFTAGYGPAPADVPEDLRNAMLMLIEHLYHNRGASTEAALKATPTGVDALLGPHRTYGWGTSQLINELPDNG